MNNGEEMQTSAIWLLGGSLFSPAHLSYKHMTG